MRKNTESKQPITERIRTMEDVIRELGEEDPLVKEYRHWLNTAEECRSEYTGVFIQLKMVCQVLNEGDFPLACSLHVYWPWFILFRQAADIPDYIGKQNCIAIPESLAGMCFGGDDDGGAICGFAYVSAGHAPSFADAHICSRICFKNKELAIFAGKHFYELWLKFYFM